MDFFYCLLEKSINGTNGGHSNHFHSDDMGLKVFGSLSLCVGRLANDYSLFLKISPFKNNIIGNLKFLTKML